MNPKNHCSTEKERRSEQEKCNEQRFDGYNTRRLDAGLEPLAWVDFLARRHGLTPIMERAARLAAQRPEHCDNIYEARLAAQRAKHRDNILLFTR